MYRRLVRAARAERPGCLRRSSTSRTSTSAWPRRCGDWASRSSTTSRRRPGRGAAAGCARSPGSRTASSSSSRSSRRSTARRARRSPSSATRSSNSRAPPRRARRFSRRPASTRAGRRSACCRAAGRTRSARSCRRSWPRSRPSRQPRARPPGAGRTRARAPGRALLAARGRASSRCAVVEHRTDDVLASVDAAVTASGTATVQAAIHGCPMVVVYRVAPLTYRPAAPLRAREHDRDGQPRRRRTRGARVGPGRLHARQPWQTRRCAC